ncbi:MAG: ribosomal protein S18-alanine N-acetyltransferase [Gemmatimonadales bacterium]
MKERVRHIPNIGVRAAEKADIGLIARIEKDSFADAWSEADFVSVLAFPQTIFLVGEDGDSGAVVGYAIALAVLDESEILNLAVEPALRGHGLGGKLLDAALSSAAERGVKSVFLEVRESNRPARRLYGSRGFEEISRRRGYYRTPVEDALVLRLAMQR